MPTSSAYARRKKVAAFRARWAEAIAAAYQRLELVPLDRVLTDREARHSEERMREYPNQIALHLLKMHRETAAQVIEKPAEEDIQEVRQRLLEKLQRLRVRTNPEPQDK